MLDFGLGGFTREAESWALPRLTQTHEMMWTPCVPENQNNTLRPIVEVLASLDPPIDALLPRYGFDLAESLPLFASLLSIPLDDRYASLQLTPDRQKELTLEALTSCAATPSRRAQYTRGTGLASPQR